MHQLRTPNSKLQKYSTVLYVDSTENAKASANPVIATFFVVLYKHCTCILNSSCLHLYLQAILAPSNHRICISGHRERSSEEIALASMTMIDEYPRHLRRPCASWPQRPWLWPHFSSRRQCVPPCKPAALPAKLHPFQPSRILPQGKPHRPRLLGYSR